MTKTTPYIPIIEEISGPPDSVALFASIKDEPYSFFLDSASDNDKLARYSFLGCEPFLVFISKGSSIHLEWSDGRRESFVSDPFIALKDILKRYAVRNDTGIPFVSGGVGYFSYDLKDFIERLPDTAVDDLDLPDCVLGFYDTVVVYDHMKKKLYISSVAKDRMEYFKDKISNSRPDIKAGSPPKPHALRSNFSKASYIKAITRAKEYIKRGDIYQVNLAQRFETELGSDPFELYCRLREASPAPFAAYLGFGDIAILSSSPERFLMKRGDYIETRPIKGTRPRGHDLFDDGKLEDELSRSAKDRAEHLMIVDLERNDLGRISRYGSVNVDEFIIMERYSTVFHLVSTISARLKEGIGPVDCLLAAFPGGSITGAPKVRAMQIIEELEPVKRSIYTGAIGYISFDGNMDTSVVIRTLVAKGRKAYFHVGGGIVADSDPEKEYEETLDKAKGLIEALACAEFLPGQAEEICKE